jgi:hypothetical protein
MDRVGRDGEGHIHLDPTGIMNGWVITLELES